MHNSGVAQTSERQKAKGPHNRQDYAGLLLGGCADHRSPLSAAYLRKLTEFKAFILGCFQEEHMITGLLLIVPGEILGLATTKSRPEVRKNYRQ